jgi:hypothetical protein
MPDIDRESSTTKAGQYLQDLPFVDHLIYM